MKLSNLLKNKNESLRSFYCSMLYFLRNPCKSRDWLFGRLTLQLIRWLHSQLGNSQDNHVLHLLFVKIGRIHWICLHATDQETAPYMLWKETLACQQSWRLYRQNCGRNMTLWLVTESDTKKSWWEQKSHNSKKTWFKIEMEGQSWRVDPWVNNVCRFLWFPILSIPATPNFAFHLKSAVVQI